MMAFTMMFTATTGRCMAAVYDDLFLSNDKEVVAHDNVFIDDEAVDVYDDHVPSGNKEVAVDDEVSSSDKELADSGTGDKPDTSVYVVSSPDCAMFHPSQDRMTFTRGTGVHFIVAAFKGDQDCTYCQLD